MDGSSKGMRVTGWVLTGLMAAFMVMDGVMKLVQPRAVAEGSAAMGWQASSLTGVGVALLVCTALYLIPRTAVLGAILLTGYLGGAVASQVRVGASMFENVFPIVFSALVWGGLWLRDARLRRLVPLVSRD